MKFGCGFGWRASVLAAAVVLQCSTWNTLRGESGGLGGVGGSGGGGTAVGGARGVYEEGVKCLAKGDYVGAGRALSQLAPFDPGVSDYSLPGRYVLGRVHQLSGERPEALAQYGAVIRDFPAMRKHASEAVRGKVTPEQQKFYDEIIHQTPEFVVKAELYSAEILAEMGKNAEAQDLLVKVAGERFPAIVQEAKFWHGVCQLQAKNYAEAERLLRDLVEHPQLGDQARWWAARARAMTADPIGPQYAKITADAAAEMIKAAGKAGELAARGDPDAAVRRAEMLLDAGDTYGMGKNYELAAAQYAQVASEFIRSAPERAEQGLEREVTALQLAGAGSAVKSEMLDASDAAAKKFEAAYPKSTLMASVLFREAENQYLRAKDAGGAAALQGAVKLYGRLMEAYPDFEMISTARASMGMCLYRLGRYREAVEQLEKIPDAERSGELATVGYVMGDCLLRGLPAVTDDALSASHLLEDGERAAKLFVAFAAANDRHPQFAEALLKAAVCFERVGGILADPAEKKKNWLQAKEMLDRAVQTLSAARVEGGKEISDLGLALMQRAKIGALLGDMAGATSDLRVYMRNLKLMEMPEAPLAVMRLSTLLRVAGKAPEAAEMMGQMRGKYEAGLLKDPARVGIAAAMAYEQGAATREAGRPGEARVLFEKLAAEYPKTQAGADAVWRAAQCRREELAGKLELARKGGMPAVAEQTMKELRATAAATAELAAGVKGVSVEAGARVYYEAAWMSRVVADAEMAAQGGSVKGNASTQAAGGTPALPEEERAWEYFERAIWMSPEGETATVARYDLAEMWMRRGELEMALDILGDALAQNPAGELGEKIRVRMAACLIGRGDENSGEAAAGLVKPVVADLLGPVRGEALYLAGEGYALAKEWPKAYEALAAFRAVQSYGNIAGVSDGALWQLAAAQREMGKPEEQRVSLEAYVAAYPKGARVDEARFELAQLYQKQKKTNEALAAYGEIIKRGNPALLGKAQLAAGLIRIEQKDYQNAVSVLAAMTRPMDEGLLAEVKKALLRVVSESPGTQWAAVAQKRLGEWK